MPEMNLAYKVSKRAILWAKVPNDIWVQENKRKSDFLNVLLFASHNLILDSSGIILVLYIERDDCANFNVPLSCMKLQHT